jgi:hypothetical protein
MALVRPLRLGPALGGPKLAPASTLAGIVRSPGIALWLCQWPRKAIGLQRVISTTVVRMYLKTVCSAAGTRTTGLTVEFGHPSHFRRQMILRYDLTRQDKQVTIPQFCDR